MKEDGVVTAAALIIQESTETEKCKGEEQLLWVQTPTRTLSRCVFGQKATSEQSRKVYCEVISLQSLSLCSFLGCLTTESQCSQLDKDGRGWHVGHIQHHLASIYQTLHVMSVADPVSCSIQVITLLLLCWLVCDCYRHIYCHLIRGHSYLCDRA